MSAAGVMEARFHGALGAFALDIAFSAPARGLTALFGPSGCGKTTALRCAAGLQRLSGRFALGAAVWQDETVFLPTHARPIGYVFQEASLFPHLSVRANLLYGHRRALAGGAAEAIRFDEVVALLGVEPLLERAPARLSGGERQRVAMGRALLTQPQLLLMDEPLAALDRFNKDEILPYLEGVRDALGVPILYVSHDIAEVERLADHLVLLDQGRVIADGPLEELQADPHLPIARLPDAGVTLPARIAGYDARYGLTSLRLLAGGQLLVPGRLGEIGAPKRIRIAAADVSLTREPPRASTILNIPPARLLAAEPQDPYQMIAAIALGEEGDGARLLTRLTRHSWETLKLARGQQLYAQIKGVALAAQQPADGASGG